MKEPKNAMRFDWKRRAVSIHLMAATTLLLSFSADSTDAKSSHKRSDITAYQKQLEDRIDLGQQSGKLTPKEIKSLQSVQHGISQLERRLAPGGLSEDEKQKIWNELEQLDRKLTSELHDRETAGWLQKWDKNKQGNSFWQKHKRKFDQTSFDKRLDEIELKTSTGMITKRSVLPSLLTYQRKQFA